METVEEFVVGGPQPFATADGDRRNGDVHRVNEVGVEKLADGRDASTEAYVLAARANLACPRASPGVASMKWKVVSDRVIGGR